MKTTVRYLRVLKSVDLQLIVAPSASTQIMRPVPRIRGGAGAVKVVDPEYLLGVY